MARWARIATVVGAILFGQIVLYGPSLSGAKILLPLDLLAQPGWYLPRDAATRAIVPHNTILSDLVLTVEPRRQFAASELRAGRIPLWNPHNFAGSPTADLYSPFDLIYYAFPTPFLLAWLQLLESLVAGLGAYLFFHRALRVSYWPAAIGGSCYPLTGFFILWQGYTLSASIAFLPWILLATDRAVRRPRGFGGPALAVLIGIVFSAEVGTTGQMLLTAGLYALWCVFDEHGWPPPLRNTLRGLSVAAGSVALGLMLAMPPILPLTEYLTTGVRTVSRVQGNEERPPIGIEALPQTVLPEMYGSWTRGSRRIVSGNRPESSAAAYAGLLATLVLAPLAFANPRRRRQPLFWASIAVLGIGWSINLPGLVQMLRLPGLNMLSHNRFVFVASFAVLALAVLGLEYFQQRNATRRRWPWGMVALLVALAGWCFHRAFVPPDPLASELSRQLALALGGARPPGLSRLEAVVAGFAADSLRAAALCIIGIGIWLGVQMGKTRAWMVPAIGALMLADLLAFGYGVAPQSDAALAYPDIPALSEVANRPGRALCVGCLPPALNRRFSLRDIRGYDGVDPAPMIELLEQVADPSSTVPPYARSMWFRPKWLKRVDDGVLIPPALDMLGVRHIIRRGSPPEGVTPTISSPGYWVVENPRALPRVFVPRRVLTLADSDARLELLGADDFDPREVAAIEIERPSGLPEAAIGSATIRFETPQYIEVALDMQSAGLVVLADLWDVGWTATIDETPVPILRTNHAIRGVVARAGPSTLVFRYQPRSFRIGLALMATSALALLAWCGWIARHGAEPDSAAQATPLPAEIR